MRIDDNPALLLIDIQKGFEDTDYWGGSLNNPRAVLTASKLLAFWRENNLPIFHIKHCSINPDSPFTEGKTGNDFSDLVKPLAGEIIIKKNVSSGFIGTTLKEQLDTAGLQKLVIVGFTTDQCVSTTTRMAGNYGFDTFLIEDATATFAKTGLKGQHFTAELIHETALASLHEEFATVLDMQALMHALSLG